MFDMHRHYYGHRLDHSIFSKLNFNIMKKNMGSTDKTIRIALAIIFAVLYFTNVVTGTLGLILLILGGIFLLTSFVSFCPLYAPFGLSTCKTKETTA